MIAIASIEMPDIHYFIDFKINYNQYVSAFHSVFFTHACMQRNAHSARFYVHIIHLNCFYRKKNIQIIRILRE